MTSEWPYIFNCQKYKPLNSYPQGTNLHPIVSTAALKLQHIIEVKQCLSIKQTFNVYFIFCFQTNLLLSCAISWSLAARLSLLCTSCWCCSCKALVLRCSWLRSSLLRCRTCLCRLSTWHSASSYSNSYWTKEKRINIIGPIPIQSTSLI